MQWANRQGLYTPSQMRSSAGYAAAKITRITNDWTKSTLSADSTARNDGETLRNRGRDLAQNDAYAVKFLSMLKTNVLGETGMLLKNRARDNSAVIDGVEKPGPLDVFANKQIQSAWKEWGRKPNCTVTRDMTWQEVNEVALETVGTDGEMLVQMVRWKGNPFGFALRLFESDHLDYELNKKLSNGNEIRMGIEFNVWGERVRYWIRRRNPNDSYYGQSLSRYEPVPADQIIHPYLRRRIGQSRGIGWMSPVAGQMNMLNGYDEAELMKARVNSSSHGFFKRTQGEGYAGPDDGSGNKHMDMEPGQWEELPEGLEPHVVDLNSPNPNYDNFERRQLQKMAAGLLTSYNVLAEDMASVNFSSMRMGLLEPREVYKMLQTWWACQFCTPVFEPWLEMQLSTGRIPLPLTKFDKFNKPQWLGRRWPYIEPNKDIDAAIKRMDANMSSLTRELGQMNIDRDELLDEIVDDNAALEVRGLSRSQVMAGASSQGEDSSGMDAGGELTQENLATEEV